MKNAFNIISCLIKWGQFELNVLLNFHKYIGALFYNK